MENNKRNHDRKAVGEQTDCFSAHSSFSERNRCRRQLYRLPHNRLAGVDPRTLYAVVKETGVCILLPVMGKARKISACLDSIEKAMEGKKWVLVIVDAGNDRSIASSIQNHRTSALYFVKDHADLPVSRISIFDILMLLASPFSEFFPWICFTDAETVMHPFKIDLLLPHAIQHSLKAVIGDSLICDCLTKSGSRIIRASDTQFWLGNFRFGIYSMIFHHSLADCASSGIMQAYQQIIRNHITPIDGRVAQFFFQLQDRSDLCVQTSFSFTPESSACTEENNIGRSGQGLESFSIVATQKFAKELLVALKSIRQYHDQPVYMVCDSYVKEILAKHQFRDIIIFNELNEHQLAEIRKVYFTQPYSTIWKFPPSQPNPPLLIKKMDVMSHALNENKNTLMLDADLIFLAPILRAFPETLMLSPELNDYRVFLDEQGKEYLAASKDRNPVKRKKADVPDNYKYQLHDVFGLFNAGFVFAQDKKFPGWWKEHFLHDSKFLEQEALNRVWRDFRFGIFSEEYNYGFWKLWRLATRQSRNLMAGRLAFSARLKFNMQCASGDNAFLFGPYFDLLSEMFTFDDIAEAAGFSAGDGIQFNSKKLRSFHLHIFYTSEHPNLKSRWRFMKEFALYLINKSTDEKHRELASYINKLAENG